VSGPHRVSAETGFSPEGEGIDPRNVAQGEGRPDDDEHAARVAESQAATEGRAAAAARGESAAPAAHSYSAADVEGYTVDQVKTFLDAATSDDDRHAREVAVREAEDAREAGPRAGVEDLLDS
jgi:hypothetical protein